jgi:hypothetical protein
MGWNNPDGMDFIDIYCMCYAASLCITSSFYSSFATPSIYLTNITIKYKMNPATNTIVNKLLSVELLNMVFLMMIPKKITIITIIINGTNEVILNVFKDS